MTQWYDPQATSSLKRLNTHFADLNSIAALAIFGHCLNYLYIHVCMVIPDRNDKGGVETSFDIQISGWLPPVTALQQSTSQG